MLWYRVHRRNHLDDPRETKGQKDVLCFAHRKLPLARPILDYWCAFGKRELDQHSAVVSATLCCDDYVIDCYVRMRRESTAASRAARKGSPLPEVQRRAGSQFRLGGAIRKNRRAGRFGLPNLPDVYFAGRCVCLLPGVPADSPPGMLDGNRWLRYVWLQKCARGRQIRAVEPGTVICLG